MRRLIIAVVLLLSCVGGILHFHLARSLIEGVTVSASYQNANQCAQDLLWLPIAMIGGPVLLLFPQRSIRWFIQPLTALWRNRIESNINYLGIRLLGLVLLLTILLGMGELTIECNKLSSLLGGR